MWLLAQRNSKKNIRDEFSDKFGLDPLEGYGCTELAPVVSFNLYNYRRGSISQRGGKIGSVGHPIPGVSAKVTDKDTGERLGVNEEGLLWIKGANVMKGYLEDAEKTAEVLADGWYNTGDIAKIDEYGFIIITDRLSRFSKIAGEMVPHGRVEEEICRLGSISADAVHVTSVEDKKKGEKLVVLVSSEHAPEEFSADSAIKALKESGMSNLWVPRRDDFIEVEEIPLLGSGKVDLKAAKKIAARCKT